ncbi:MAG TPA: amino acid adenylation domain-containing protein [Longimicrobium sp.]|nr:amino acid adenylation domain-containing protein [Longimicrobium sp.]
MTAAEPAALSRAEKEERLRRLLAERMGRARTAPASFAQERLWVLDRMDGAGAAYNLLVGFRIPGALDRPALERALGELVRRHESLRTTFAEEDGAPVQVIAPFRGFSLTVEDLPSADTATLRRVASEEVARPFDLSAGPLFRARLLRLGAEEHALFLGMHHIVGDSWSSVVMARELAKLYAAFREGLPSPLPEPALQYADHAARQRERLRGAGLERELAYWRERLAGAPALLELPTDFPRPAARTYRGASVPVALGRAVVEPLEALARAEGATLHMVLLAAFQALLAKWAGRGDVIVGIPTAGRGRRELEALVGFFVNTVAVRTDLAGDPTFREALRRARAAALGAYAHQEVPFERVVAALRPERSMGHTPVVQVMLALEVPLLAESDLTGFRALPLKLEAATSKFDLTLALETRKDGVGGVLEYSTDLWERSTIERLVAHLARMLEQAGRDPDVRLSALELMEPEERLRVVDTWNRTATAYPSESSIPALFEQWAARAPEAPAVVYGDESLTYGELNARANRLARHLVRLGVGAEARVGVHLERGVEMVVAMLAALKAGGAYVPLEPGYPAERLAFMLADSGSVVLITQASLRGAFDVPPAVRVVSVDGDDAARIAAEDAESVDGGASARSLAYVVYTSGSTGTPKGTGVEHRGAVRLVRETDAARIGPGDRVAQASTPSFDAAAFEIWGALLNGAALVGISREVVLSPDRMAAALRDGGVTVVLLTTALFNGIARERPDAFRPLRAVLFGGEAAEADAVRAVLEAGAPERVVNVYGPTENATFSSTHTVGEVPAGARTVPIGRPNSNSTAYVLGAALEVLPVGYPGELCVGGDGVARGYLGRPALTAERFVPDPFSAAPGARLYRTGDRARWRPDGTLDFLGRLDGQVKVRGFRVETGEVEAALRRHPAVSDCAVEARADASGTLRLVAYVVGSADADADGLRAQLRRTLPDYMVPSAFVALDRLPLTTNGKVDRAALPEPEATAAEYVAPRTEAETALARIWAEVLQVERVGVEDDFFALGGHSLLAMRVVSRVREALGVEPTVRALFEAPTLAEQARAIEALRGAKAADASISKEAADSTEASSSAGTIAAEAASTGTASAEIVSAETRSADAEDAIPLSFAQERLWLLDRLRPGSAVYNVPAGVRLEGPLDREALERALGEIVRRHEALRTTFHERGGAPVQVVSPFAGFTLPVEDLSALSETEREHAVRRRAREDAAEPFDLAAGPLFRARLLRLGDEDHALLLCLHHGVTDGWSMGVLFGELGALYAAFREGRPSPLPELEMRFADYARWERERLSGESLEGLLAYWRKTLAGAPAILELPTDRPRPAEQSYRGADLHLRLPAGLPERLGTMARREGATLYMVCLAAFQALLARYAGSDDVVVGSPVAGRTRDDTEGLIGFFVNTVAMRTDLGGDPTFRELLARVRDVALEAYDHQELPFEKLVAELQPERSLSHSPLFQVLFSLQHGATSRSGLPGLRTRGVDTVMEVAKFDLTLVLIPHAEGIGGTLTYATDLFDRETAERMVRHFTRVLEQVADRPDVRLSAMELLDDAERRRVLETWSGSDAPYPTGRCIHRLFEAQAARTPGAVALAHDGELLTYAALNARANRLARHLRRLGVGPETRVGVLQPRAPELVVSLLAVWKAGGAYVPLDPAWPAERVAFMAADSGVRVLLVRGETAGALPAAEGVRIVDLDAAAAEVAREGGEELDGGAEARNLAYLIYTSGSTGVPKGVAIEHESAAAMLAWAWELYSAEELGGMLASTSICFDISVFELFAPLTRGGRVILVENALALPHSPHAAEVRLVDTVPSAMAALLETGGLPAGARTVNLAGEPLAQSLVDALYARGVERVYDLYGPSEDTTFSTWALRRPGGAATIGRPLPNTRAYVLDAAFRPVPTGVAGELFLAGRGVTRGYLGRPALTAERYLPDPFGDGGRLYRTGDRVRWRADGTLEYLGRLDQQVKVRGFRVEPGEIEAVLRRHPGVAACAVAARAEGADRRLVAYVVGPAGADELRARLRASVPEYMVPGAFVRLDALPLTPSGKIDRRALPAPDFAPEEDRSPEALTPVEEVLAGIWAEVLRVERVGPGDHFFHLGGHSLLATVVVARVQEALGVRLPLGELFAAPTLAEQAARIEALRRAGAPALPPVVPVGRDGPLPLSFAQERLWFLDRLQPGSAAYNVPVAVRLAGALDARALERAVGEVVRRHEVLRTVFREVDGAPVQVVRPFAGFSLPVEEVADEAEAARRAAEEAARPFDLQAGPLFRARLLRIAADDHVLAVTLHHAVSDEWSFGVLFRELSAAYAAAAGGSAPNLPEPPVQYADYAVWKRETLSGEALERQLAYWRGRLSGAPAVTELPSDRPRPPVQTHRGARESFALPAELLERLEAVRRAEGVTLFMVLLGALQVLLAKYGDADDVVVGTPITGRTRHEVAELVGFFTNTLVLRTDLSGDPSFREVLRRVRETALGAYDHQDVPFERLVEALQPERALGHSPLFQVMLVLGDAGGPGLDLPGVEVRRFGGGTDTSKFDLMLGLTPHAGGLAGSLEYSTDLFDRATVARMLGHLRRVLEQAAADPGARLSSLELMDEAERRLVVDEWNATEAEVPATACVHHLVEARARRTPDAVAVVHNGESLTYRDLDRRANALAHRLAALGVGPETRVGICLERGPAMIVAVLAVLKAGGAYVPFDPSYPVARLAFMAADSAVPVLLTQDSLRDALPALDGVRVLHVDGDEDGDEDARDDAPATGVGPANLAFVLYTSGSTGRPKGVAMPHAALVSLVAWHLRDDEAPRHTLQFSSLSFDVSFQEIAATLASGGTLVLVDDALRRDPRELLRYLAEHRVERLFLPFVALQSLAEAARG